MLPIKSAKIPMIHSDINREYGETVSTEEIIRTLDNMADKGDIIKQRSPMGDIYKSI